MRTDIKLTTDLGVEINPVGDLSVVRGDDAIVQRAVLRALNVGIPWRGERLTRENAVDLRDVIVSELQNDTVINSAVSGRVVQTSTDSVELAFTLGETERRITIQQ